MTGIIKVDTIQNNAGTTGLTIDSSGRVLTSQKVYFYAGSSNGDTTVTAGSLLPFNATYQNVGNAFSTSSYLFTAPVTGVYLFVHNTFVAGGSSNISRTTWQRNGSQFNVGGDIDEARTAANSSSSFQCVIGLDANDTFGVRLRSSVGDVLFYMGHCNFSGCLLG